MRQPPEDLDDPVGGVLVEAAGGLVGEEDVDLAGERPGDGHPLPPAEVREATARPGP
ncbi:hypothetical protein ACWEDZ_19460 [Streptomyces sp. NPDC005047]